MSNSPDGTIRNEFFRAAPSGFFRGGGGPHGDSVKKEKKHEWPAPHKVFMIYMKFDPRGGLIARHSMSAISSDLEQTEQQLFRKLANGGAGAGVNFENLVWEDPCYVTLVIDNPGWRFHWADCKSDEAPDEAADEEAEEEPAVHDPMVFLEKKHLANKCEWQLYHENKSFYDAEDVDIKVDGNERKAVRCINYLRDESGDVIGKGDQRNYCFEIYLEAPFSLPGKEERITILIDPDGQNQGPPPLHGKGPKN